MNELERIKIRIAGKIFAHQLMAPSYESQARDYFDRWSKDTSNALLFEKWMDAFQMGQSSREIIRVLEEVLVDDHEEV